jgi:hypothetical protein
VDRTRDVPLLPLGRLAHVDENGRRGRITKDVDFLGGDFPDLGTGLAKEVGV